MLAHYCDACLAERKIASEAVKRAQAKREKATQPYRPGQAGSGQHTEDLHRAPERHLAELVTRVRTSLQDELGERTQVTVYEGRNSLEAIVEAYDPQRKTSWARAARDISWEESDSIAFSDV